MRVERHTPTRGQLCAMTARCSCPLTPVYRKASVSQGIPITTGKCAIPGVSPTEPAVLLMEAAPCAWTAGALTEIRSMLTAVCWEPMGMVSRHARSAAVFVARLGQGISDRLFAYVSASAYSIARHSD